ncbi:MAG: DUF3108 domain-containing protein [candidate division KSB1 bacterium]|nr:DUF3108 domain-containing protein [candidate division KSB1 bacterium]MDZ7301894.1 DUF3108 domain-containing protein [candidate division KSB1 bacterium]
MRKKENYLQQFLPFCEWLSLPVVMTLMFLLCMAIPVVSIAQQSRADSLNSAAQSHSDSGNVSNRDAEGRPNNSASPAPALRIVPNRAFRVGESLTYMIRYGQIIAGNARLSIPQIIETQGRPCYNIISEAWSNKFFSTFFKVEDRVESYTDVDGIFSWWFSKRLREGGFKLDHEVEFDQINHLAIMKQGSKRDTMAVPPFVQDVLSAMYLVRTMNIAPGDSIFIDNHSDGKLFPLKIVVHRREKINIKAGRFTCLVVEPFLKTPALFQQKGRVVVYLTDDERKIPVMMVSQIYVKAFKLGSVIAEAEKIEGVSGY